MKISNDISKHFTPQGDALSYYKLKKFVVHQIQLYEEAQRKVEENALYYVYSDPEAVKDYTMLSEKIEEWQWFLDNIILDEVKIKSITI